MSFSPEFIDSKEEFFRKLKFLMFSRVLVITFLLGSTVLVHFKEKSLYFEPYLISLYIIIVSTYSINLFYILILNRIKNLISFAYTQIVLDLMYVTAIIYVTGGIESIFSFLYILSIINASILLYRRGGLGIASASSIFYGACLGLEYYGTIPPLFGQPPSILSYKISEVFYTIVINIAAFYTTAFLSSFLAEQVRKSKEELKEKELSLSHLEALHENIVQSIGSGILTLNNQKEITSFNAAAQVITKLKTSEILWKNFYQIFFASQDKNINLTNLPKRFETSFTRPDGHTLILGFSSSILRDKQGKEIGKIFTFQDLTRFREMEEQIKRMDRLAAVGELAAGIAHEIRNPLTSLSGSIQVLRDDLDLSNENRKLMDIALSETKRLNNLISDFLLFAQPGRGEKRRINLSSLVEETIDLFAHSPECKKNIGVTKSISPGLFMEGNAGHLKQVFWNILKNAAQSQPIGGVIYIETTINDRKDTSGENFPKEKIKISIKDSGCGIPKEIQKKIFDPFFTTKEQGSGLGLAISYRIIENHKGEITIHSKENQGTEVIIFFPLISNDP